MNCDLATCLVLASFAYAMLRIHLYLEGADVDGEA